MQFNDILFFDKMLTPKIITVVYWLGLIGCVVGGLFTMTQSFLTGLAVLVLGSIAVRVYCEIVIVFFKINESLVVIRDK